MLITPIPVLSPDPAIDSCSGIGKLAKNVLLPLLLLGIFMLISWLTLKAAKHKYPNTKFLPWMLISLGIGLALILAHGATLLTFQGMLLCSVLVYASIADISSHEVPDCIWVMILILAFTGFNIENLLSMVVGAVAVFVPQIIIAAIKPGTYGGADIKVSTALAFLMGVWKGIFAVISGLVIALITMAILRKMKKLKKEEPYPIIPCLSIGAMTAFLL